MVNLAINRREGVTRRRKMVTQGRPVLPRISVSKREGWFRNTHEVVERFLTA